MIEEKKWSVQKNEEFILEITGLTGEGQGIGRKEGMIVFVPGALPGETVKVHVIKTTSSYAVAKCLEILQESPSRIHPSCAVYERCGGCTLQHLKYHNQLELKHQQVIDAFERLGGFKNPPVEKTVEMEEPWRYRNKGAFPFGKTKEGFSVFGFYAERSHRLIPISDCLIQDERTIEIARKVAAWAEENDVQPYDELTGQGCLRHVMARVTSEGESMAVVITKGPLKKREMLVDALSDLDSVYHNRNDAATNVIFGETDTLLSGKETIEERICGYRFQIGPRSFLQVNPIQTEKLYRIAMDYAKDDSFGTAMDLYCGIGTISLLLANSFKHVIGIEIVESAIKDAKENAQRNGINNVDFYSGDVGKVVPQIFEKGYVPNVVLLDPPRKGCETAVLNSLVQKEIQRIVYISCNPSTLARDASLLAKNGFQLIKATPVDMFPNTSHVETIALLQRQNS